MNRWRYHNPVVIASGGKWFELAAELTEGASVILLTSPGFMKRGIVERLREKVGASLKAVFSQVQPNPTFEAIQRTFQDLASYEYDFIVAIGGGSVLDTAKGLAATVAARDPNWLERHLKEGEPEPRDFEPTPTVAIPTTSGTGSELTMWATVWDFDAKKKYSIKHSLLYPRYAVLDPELTLTLPRAQTIYSGLDALSHCLEAVWNKNANPISDHYAKTASRMILAALPTAVERPNDYDARRDMLLASTLAGLAFSNTETALAHSISYYMTTHYGLPHGLACSFCLPFVLKANWGFDFARDQIVSEMLCRNSEDPVEVLAGFLGTLGVKLRFSDYGVAQQEGRIIVQQSLEGARGANSQVRKDIVLKVYDSVSGSLI